MWSQNNAHTACACIKEAWSQNPQIYDNFPIAMSSLIGHQISVKVTECPRDGSTDMFPLKAFQLIDVLYTSIPRERTGFTTKRTGKKKTLLMFHGY